MKCISFWRPRIPLISIVFFASHSTAWMECFARCLKWKPVWSRWFMINSIAQNSVSWTVIHSFVGERDNMNFSQISRAECCLKYWWYKKIFQIKVFQNSISYKKKKKKKTQWEHMSFFHRSEAGGLEKLICLKYNNVPKLESRCILGFNAAENIDYIKKYFK